MRRSDKPRHDPAEHRLATALAPEAHMIARAGQLGVAASLIWIVMAASVAHGLATLVEGRASAATLLGAAAIFTIAGGLRIALGLRAAAQLDRAADKILAAERQALIATQDRLSPRAGRTASAGVAALMTDKLPHLVPFVLRYRPAARRAAIVPLAFVLCTLPMSWAVAVILLVAGPLIPVFMALVGMAAREASERQMDEIGSLSALLAERLAALTDIRLLDARDRMGTEFEARAEGLRARTMAVLRVAFLSSTVLELFAAIGVAMVAVYVGFSLLGEIGFGAWATPLTLWQGIFMLMLAPEFFQPLRDLAAGWHDKAAALAVARDLVTLEDQAPQEILGTGGPGLAPATAPLIRLSSLGLGPIGFPDLEIAPGASLAFTGPSGSGKSTLIALIGGLERPDRGHVVIGAAALSDQCADDWRARVAWVPQAAQFPAGSLRDTLLMAAPEGTGTAEIAIALRLASAEAVVARLPQGLATELGEAGGGVSGGEARRLMLAQAALSGRAVILADEPTADLDAETAAEVIAALRLLNARGATVIVATHDRALAAAMDRRIALCPQRVAA